MMMVMRAGGEFILNISEAGARCGAGGQAAAIIYKQTTLDWIGISIRMSITIRSTHWEEQTSTSPALDWTVDSG